MDPEDAYFFDTVLAVVARYGMKRTTMAELANAAGVSRQTLYDRYGDKDGVMAAAIDHLTARLLSDLRVAFAAPLSLAEKIDAYYELAVWPIFNSLQNMPDAVDFETGRGPTSTAASDRGSAAKQALLAEMLTGHLRPGGPSAKDVGDFLERSSTRAKMTERSAAALARFLAVLKASVLALAGET